LARAQKLAGVASTVAIVAAILIVIATVTRDLVAPALETLRDAEFTANAQGWLTLAKTVAAHAILFAPNFMLAAALHQLSGVLDEYGTGQFFTLRAAAGLRGAGEDTAWALAFKVLISPTVFGWVTGDSRGIEWRTEFFDLGLLAFALALMVLGRVLEAAARIKEENEQIV
jgi:hypothetical protein